MDSQELAVWLAGGGAFHFKHYLTPSFVAVLKLRYHVHLRDVFVRLGLNNFSSMILLIPSLCR